MNIAAHKPPGKAGPTGSAEGWFQVLKRAAEGQATPTPPAKALTWLSLYRLLMHTSTTALPSTALAIASNVDPDMRSTSIHVWYPARCSSLLMSSTLCCCPHS